MKTYSVVKALYNQIRIRMGKRGNSIRAAREVEEMVFRVVGVHGEADEFHKQRTLELLKAIDQLVSEEVLNDEFLLNGRIRKAYEQLEGAQSTLVFEKGFPKLRALREELWQTLAD